MTDHDPSPRAQDTFTAMLRERIAPTLREWGFRGSGQTFELRDDKYWAVLGFQRSRWSRSDELEFTITVAVVGKVKWEQMRAEFRSLGKRPAAGDAARAGALRLDQVPGAGESWWLVRPDQDTSGVVAEVLDAVERVALPWLNARIGRSAAVHTLDDPAAPEDTLLV